MGCNVPRPALTPAWTPAPDPPLALPRLAIAGFSAILIAVFAPNGAHADDFEAFRIPEHRALSWTALLSSSGRRQVAGTGDDQENRSLNGTLQTDFWWLSDSDPRRTTFSGTATVSGSRSRQELRRDYAFDARDEQINRLRSAAEYASLQFRHERSTGTIPITFSAAGFANGIWDQSWNRRESQTTYPSTPYYRLYDRVESRRTDRRWAFSHFVEIDLAGGVGRVRDATPVYDALVFEARLREAGALRGPLQQASRQRLVDLFAMRGDFAGTRDRPGRDLWAEVARILAEDPATEGDGPDPRSVLRAMEPMLGVDRGSRSAFPVSPLARSAGTSLELLLIGRQGQTVQRIDYLDESRWYLGDSLTRVSRYASAGHTGSNAADAFVGLGASYHRPVGIAWQIDASARGLLPLREPDRSATFTASAGAARIVSDRWLGYANLRHDWLDAVRTRGPTGGDQSLWSLRLGLQYYLEDRIALELSAFETQSWLRGDATTASHRFVRDEGFDVGLTYRVAGRFRAPGSSL